MNLDKDDDMSSTISGDSLFNNYRNRTSILNVAADDNDNDNDDDDDIDIDDNDNIDTKNNRNSKDSDLKLMRFSFSSSVGVEAPPSYNKSDIPNMNVRSTDMISLEDSHSDNRSLFPSMNQFNVKNNDSIFMNRISSSDHSDMDNIHSRNRNRNRNRDGDGDGDGDGNGDGNGKQDIEEMQNFNDLESSISIDNDDIRSSVLHRILDNESFSDGINHDKIFFNKLYKKYDKNSNQQHESEIRDFEQYNRLLQREENLRRKLDVVAKRKGKNLSRSQHNDNILTTLEETELNNLFGNLKNPKDWDEEIKLNKDKKKENKSIFKNLLKRVQSPEQNTPTNEKKDDRYVDYVSTFSSIPIDDDIGIEDLPIDSQPFKTNKRQRDNNYNYNSNNNDYNYNSYFPNYGNEESSNDIDIVVSGQEKVDYNFHRIDQYKNIDPQEIQNSKPHNKFITFLKSINPLRIIRIQRANKYQIQRKLNVRHLHQIALGGTLGVGLLLSSGKAFTIAGPLGCLLGFIISGFIVISTMLSFCEIVTLIPLCGGVSGIASRFVDDAFGFALGIVYWVTYMVSLPTEITAAAIMLSFYTDLKIPSSRTAGWITLFFSFTLLINLFDIRVYGEFEYYSTIVKIFILLGLMIYMIVLNRGGSAPYHDKIGFKYWDTHLSDLKNNITFGPFRPTFDVNDIGLGSLNGIGGHRGRFLQVLIASVIASYAYVGTEIVILAGSESRNPRQAIPSATKNIYYRIFIFYIVAVFLIGLNIYSGDPRLLRYFSRVVISDSDIQKQNEIIKLVSKNSCDHGVLSWAGFSNGNQSPWVIAIQSAGLCSFASAVNAFLLYFALTAASSQLYASSRTLYFMSIQNKAPKLFSLCTKKGVPYMSVIFTAAFGLLSYLSVENDTALVFERLVSVCATAGLLVWSGMCLSFIRFYYALKLRPDIVNRDDDDYPYRSPFQPYLAYSGLILGMVLVFASGFIVFLKDEWSPSFFISSYGCLFLFIISYFGYKIFARTRIQRLDQVDLDSGRREIDRVIWEDEKNYASNFREILTKGINLFI